MKRHIVQLLVAGAISLVASTQARANISYLGGRVMPSVRIIPIFYGNSWTTSPSATSQQAAARAYLTELADYITGAKNPSGKEPLYVQYGIMNAQVTEMPCFSCIDMSPRVLTNNEITGIIHSYQQQNNITYAADKLFLLLPGPGFGTSAGDCGFAGNEGDASYFAVVASACSTFQRTISGHVFKSATNPNLGASNLPQGWQDVFAPCSGSVINFGAGEIQLPWNNRAGACPQAGPNIAFNDQSKELLQVIATSPLGQLFHALRYADGTWTGWGNVNAVIGSSPSQFHFLDAQATLGVFNHVVARGQNGNLYHTIRHDTGWTQFVDVNAASGSGPARFNDVSVANVNGDLHVCTIDFLVGVSHAIRSQNGVWSGFGDVLRQTGNPPGGPVVAMDCAGIGPDMHIVMVTQSGGLFHSIRFGNSLSWQPLGDAKAVAGLTGSAKRVSVAAFGGDLHIVVATDNQQFHAIRHSAGAGSWTPFAPVPNSVGALPAAAGTQGFLQLMSLDQTFIPNHRTWDTVSGWSGINSTGAPPPPPHEFPNVEAVFGNVTAAGSLGF